MANYPWTLEKYKGQNTRHTCPYCGRKKEFTLYVYTDTGEPINEKVGMCNRLSNCGAHVKPKEYFQSNGGIPERLKTFEYTKEKQLPISYISTDIFKKTLLDVEGTIKANSFVSYLSTKFSFEQIAKLLSDYKLGTAKDTSCIFWQIDGLNRVRTGKIIRYENGHRVKKEGEGPVNWVHKKIKLKDFNLTQCPFGTHLLSKDFNKIVCVVEAEKTACIASMVFPQYTWVSVGGKGLITENTITDRLSFLGGRDVVLVPDMGCAEVWGKACEVAVKSRIFKSVSVLDFLEQQVDTFADGDDLADFLLKH
jgi:hypothetical protein